MKQPELSDDDEKWLKEHLASLPEAFNFDFGKATRNLIADHGIEWVKSRAELLKSQAEYIASL